MLIPEKMVTRIVMETKVEMALEVWLLQTQLFKLEEVNVKVHKSRKKNQFNLII